MNNAKKLAKNNGVGTEKKETKAKGSLLSMKNKILIGLGVAVMVILCAGVCYMQLRPRAILKVTQVNAEGGADKESTVYMKEAVYNIWMLETQYNQYASLYQQMYGSTYWEMENADEEGRNGASAAKKQTMDAIKQREILCMEAEQLGYSLTDEEKKASDESVKTAMEQMSAGQKKIPGLDEETLKAVFAKNALAEKYRQVIVAESGIDTEALKATVDKDDYHQYTMQYYKVSNKTTGEDGAESDVTAEQKETNLKNMEALKEKAKTTEDFSTLVAEGDTTGIQAVQTQELIKKDMKDSTFLTEKQRKKLIKMKNNEISDVIEGEDGYYLVKMVNNDDSAAYDAQCTSIVEAEETKAFNERYEQIKLRYTTEVQNYWKGRIKLGSYTVVE